MINFWYVSTEYEILIDTDNAHRSFKHFDMRLQGAIESEKLAVYSIETHSSTRPNHLHTLITLKKPMDAIERQVWAIILHSDIYRGCCNIMRAIKNVPSPDLLITPLQFMRKFDAVCFCETKHNAETMFHCPVALELRGEERTLGFFGKPKKNA